MLIERFSCWQVGDLERLWKRENDGVRTMLSTATSGLSLTTSTTYTAKVVITESGGAQSLDFYVDLNGDNDYLDANEHPLSSLGEVDDVWSAGHVGLYRGPAGSSIQQYDNVKIGYDNNADGDIDDAGDDIQVSDSFNSDVITLSYDNNGNLTDDGIQDYDYDAWNRLVKVSRTADGDTTTVAEYEYDGKNRRTKKTVSNSGVEDTAGDGGDTTVHFYYDRKWRTLETRNGSDQPTRQWAWGTQYVDEPLFMDVNDSPTTSTSCAPDESDSDDDRRYFYHQDRNWNVVALTESNDGVGTDGRIVERYAYTPYGEFIVLQGDAGSGELGNVLPTSSIGNPLAHQGLGFDQEKVCYQNRWRTYMPALHLFHQRDPLRVAVFSSARCIEHVQGPGAVSGVSVALTQITFVDGASPYTYVRGNPATFTDSSGLTGACDTDCWDTYVTMTMDCAALLGYSFWQCMDNAREALVDCTMANPSGCANAGAQPASSCSYPASYRYSGVSAQCMCRCMGDDPWSKRVRGCLKCYYDADCDPDRSHKICYGVGDRHHDRPHGKLACCALRCLFE